MESPVIVIAGPTAAGKTALAVSMAARLDAEIVSADSMQVYRGLDIGTAKPTQSERGGIPHHLIDIADPDEPFDAAAFVREADAAILDIRARGKTALVVGGTGLYIRALLHGLQGGPSPDPDVRRDIERRAEEIGWPSLHLELARKDPKTAARLHPNDGVRILRALEVFDSSGVPISKWHESHGFGEERYAHRYLALFADRKTLNERIDARVERMMADGFLGEVKGLMAEGFGPEIKPMQGLGYRRLCQHLKGEMTLDEAVTKIKTDTRRFAKRQMTWFKSETKLEWVEPDEERIAASIAGAGAR